MGSDRWSVRGADPLPPEIQRIVCGALRGNELREFVGVTQEEKEVEEKGEFAGRSDEMCGVGEASREIVAEGVASGR